MSQQEYTRSLDQNLFEDIILTTSVEIAGYLWELVVVTQLSQGLADVTENALAFGVIIQNDITRDNQD